MVVLTKKLKMETLSNEELKNINAGCGGEDYSCPQMEALVQALKNIRIY